MKYLVAIDGSTCAARALDKALQVANPQKDEIDLICVGPEIDMNEEYKSELTERILRLLHPYEEKSRKENIVPKLIVAFGDPREVIVDTATNEKVMGTHGVSWQDKDVTDIPVGSVSQYVLRNATCSFLLAK